jgi:hypothetical protein
MKPQYLATVAMVIAALVGLAKAGESTSVFRQGNSTATITQDDGGSSTPTRRVIRRGRNSQTIIQQQGGNSVTVRQSEEEDDPEDLDKPESDDWW